MKKRCLFICCGKIADLHHRNRGSQKIYKKHFLQFNLLTQQEAEEAVEADVVTEPPFSKGTLHVGKPYVISITVLRAQGIPAQYTDVFCQIR